MQDNKTEEKETKKKGKCEYMVLGFLVGLGISALFNIEYYIGCSVCSIIGIVVDSYLNKQQQKQ